MLNPDGSQRTQQAIVGGVLSSVNVVQQVPVYQIITPGGDSHAVFNFEYRIPLVGPVSLVPFFDAGVNRVLYKSQLTVNPGQVANLNAQFPQANFSATDVPIAPGTQKVRMSTGLEFDVILPVVNAPFRVYYAYNPSVVREYLSRRLCSIRQRFRMRRRSRMRWHPTGRHFRCSKNEARFASRSAGRSDGARAAGAAVILTLNFGAKSFEGV